MPQPNRGPDPGSPNRAAELDRSRVPVRIRQLGRIRYPEAMRLQDRLIAEVTASSCEPGTILSLEHEPVYTLGRAADEADLMGAHERFSVPVFRVGRGGGVTFHGPGQIVVYPIVRLPGGGRNVSGFIRALERAMISTCTRFGVATRAPEGETGVWADGGKVGSIGIGVRRGVCFHGLALNVRNRLDYFENIVPCRAPGMTVTTLAREASGGVSQTAVERALIEEVCRALDLDPVAWSE